MSRFEERTNKANMVELPRSQSGFDGVMRQTQEMVREATLINLGIAEVNARMWGMEDFAMLMERLGDGTEVAQTPEDWGHIGLGFLSAMTNPWMSVYR